MVSLRRKKKDALPKPADENDRADQMFIDEVNEELKQERAAELWKKYGRYITAGLIIVILGIGGFQYWKTTNRKAAEQASIDFAQASQLLSDGKTKDAVAAFEALAAKSSGYGHLARLQAAAIKAKSGDLKGAAASYKALAQDSGADPVFKNVALILWGLTGLDHENPQQMVDALKPLTADQQRWRFTARELTALYHLKAGKKDDAMNLFKALAADTGAPAALRVRANEMVAVLSRS